MIAFESRAEAGRQLAEALQEYGGRPDVLILALPRGGVPVAYEVAQRLGNELDVLIVRKLGCPHQEELAMGAIASGGIRVLNDAFEIPPEVLEEVTQAETLELERRESAYRGTRPLPEISGRTVILADDGLATGATMRAAVAAVRKQSPKRILVAVPVAPRETVRELQRITDGVVCLMIPRVFVGVGQFYRDFAQTSDDVVRELLQRAWSTHETATGHDAQQREDR